VACTREGGNASTLTYLLARPTVLPLCVRPARPYEDLSLPWDLGFEHSMEVWPNKGKGKMLVSAPLRVRWSQAEDTRLVVAALRTLRPDDFSEVLAQVPRNPQHRCALMLVAMVVAVGDVAQAKRCISLDMYFAQHSRGSCLLHCVFFGP
jgi:hypothetical protein